MDKKLKAVILMLVSSLAFACSAAAVKLSGDLPVFEKVFFRNILAVVIAFIALRRQKEAVFGKKENQKYLLLRSLLGVLGMVLYFYAISNLYLADSAMLHKLFPFFVTVFAGSLDLGSPKSLAAGNRTLPTTRFSVRSRHVNAYRICSQ